MDRTYVVYILASRSRVVYTGVTNNLEFRLFQHRLGRPGSFTQRYRVHRLVWFEIWGTPRAAIAREKQIKGWIRAKKVALIESKNPKWQDLSEQLFGKGKG